MTLSTFIKQKRAKLGITSKELSKRAGLSFSSICRIEDGRNRRPSADHLVKIAGTLQVSKLALFKLAGYFDSNELSILDPIPLLTESEALNTTNFDPLTLKSTAQNTLPNFSGSAGLFAIEVERNIYKPLLGTNDIYVIEPAPQPTKEHLYLFKDQNEIFPARLLISHPTTGILQRIDKSHVLPLDDQVALIGRLVSIRFKT